MAKKTTKQEKTVYDLATEAANEMAMSVRMSIGIIYDAGELDMYRDGWIAGYRAAQKAIGGTKND